MQWDGTVWLLNPPSHSPARRSGHRFPTLIRILLSLYFHIQYNYDFLLYSKIATPPFKYTFFRYYPPFSEQRKPFVPHGVPLLAFSCDELSSPWLVETDPKDLGRVEGCHSVEWYLGDTCLIQLYQHPKSSKTLIQDKKLSFLIPIRSV